MGLGDWSYLCSKVRLPMRGSARLGSGAAGSGQTLPCGMWSGDNVSSRFCCWGLGSPVAPAGPAVWEGEPGAGTRGGGRLVETKLQEATPRGGICVPALGWRGWKKSPAASHPPFSRLPRQIPHLNRERS